MYGTRTLFYISYIVDQAVSADRRQDNLTHVKSFFPRQKPAQDGSHEVY